ncbi:hypothetical protein WA171_000841 [Blastocystis sp. BT1]
MQLSTSLFDEERVICNQIVHSIQQPFSFHSLQDIPLTSVTLNIINQRISEVLTQRVQTNLSLDVLDELMKSIYTIEMDRCATQWFQTLPSEEVSINNIMQLFPEIEGEDPQLNEYSSLRKSIESSVRLFGELKKELEETRVVVVFLTDIQIDTENEWVSFYTPEDSANVLIKKAEGLLNSLSEIVHTDSFQSLSPSQSKRVSRELVCSEAVFEAYSKRRKEC